VALDMRWQPQPTKLALLPGLLRSSPEDEPDPESDYNALEFAALYEHFEIFGLRQIRLDSKQEHAHDLIMAACHNKTADLLKRLVDLGYPVNDQQNGGLSHIESLLNSMAWWPKSARKKIDSDATREKMKMLHLLVQHGARWVPEDLSSMNTVRRTILCLDPDYTVELIWIMAKYGGCKRSVIETLLKTPTIRAHVDVHSDRISQLMARLAEKSSGALYHESDGRVFL